MNIEFDEFAAAIIGVGGTLDLAVDRWQRRAFEQWQPSNHIAPTQPVMTVRQTPSNREAAVALWDLRPAWRKPGGGVRINARLETISESPMWRQAFDQRRIMVPMNGWFEWVGEKGNKVPYFLFSSESPLLMAAGIGEVRNIGTDDDPEWEMSCAIITTTAMDASGTVHDRMPVFLTEGFYDEWLDPEPLGPTRAASMVAQLHAVTAAVSPTITTHRVTRNINRSGYGWNDPSILEPAAD